MASRGRDKLKKYAIRQDSDAWWVRPPHGMFVRVPTFETAIRWAELHYESKRRRR